jgi:hypothetical protein
MAYTIEQIRAWAERYTDLGSFIAVGKVFGVNPKTVTKHLKLNKAALGIDLVFETYNELKERGLKRCNGPCNQIKPVSDFETHDSGLRRHACRECRHVSGRAYREANKSEIAASQKAFRDEHKDDISKKRRLAYIQKKYAYNANQREYYKNNRVAILKHRKSIHLTRMKHDPQYRMSRILRSRFSMMLKERASVKPDSVLKLVGCDMFELTSHIESMFYANSETGLAMTWDNHGFVGWHIDHIKPLASFNLLDPDQVKAAWHYTNLQPLWSKENWSKGARVKTQETNHVVS